MYSQQYTAEPTLLCTLVRPFRPEKKKFRPEKIFFRPPKNIFRRTKISRRRDLMTSRSRNTETSKPRNIETSSPRAPKNPETSPRKRGILRRRRWVVFLFCFFYLFFLLKGVWGEMFLFFVFLFFLSVFIFFHFFAKSIIFHVSCSLFEKNRLTLWPRSRESKHRGLETSRPRKKNKNYA